MGWQPLRTVQRSGTARARPNREAFLRLAVTHAVVMAGDAMVTVALAGSIFLSTDVNGARGRVLLSLVLTMAPFAVVAPLLGPAIDRSKGGRRLMVVAAAGGRAITCLYMSRVVDDLLLFLPSALVLLILSKAHAVAKSALVPATVDSPEDLVQAGGRLAVLAAVSGMTAAAIGAAILKIFDAAWVLRTAAVVYGAGAVCALRTRPAPPAAPAPADHVDELVRSRGVSLAAISMTALRGMSGFLTFAIAFSFRRTHAPTWWYGVVIGGAVLGGFVGNLIGPRLRTVIAEERILMLTLGGLGAIGFVSAYAGSRPAVALVSIAAGMANGTGRLAFDAIVQRDGSEGSRGRSFARYEATFQLVWVGAAALPVAISIPAPVAALLVGIASAAALAYYAAGRGLAVRIHGRPESPVAPPVLAGGESGALPGPPSGVLPPGVLAPGVLAPGVLAPVAVPSSGRGSSDATPGSMMEAVRGWDPGVTWAPDLAGDPPGDVRPDRAGDPPGDQNPDGGAADVGSQPPPDPTPQPSPGPRRNPRRSRPKHS